VLMSLDTTYLPDFIPEFISAAPDAIQGQRDKVAIMGKWL